jgi:zinc-finger binding domain of transposase IS66
MLAARPVYPRKLTTCCNAQVVSLGPFAAIGRQHPKQNWYAKSAACDVAYPAPAVCPCCGDERLRKIGEDVTETLELIPRQWKVIAHVREKFSCRACEAITQAPAPRLPSPWPVRSVAVGAVFGANRLRRGHDLGSNLPRCHIGRRETEADSRCKQSKQSKNLQSFFRPPWVCHCETVRWGDGPPPDFARYLPDHTRLIKTDDFQARSSTALEAAM